MVRDYDDPISEKPYAIIFGGSSGIGLATAQLLLGRYRVVALSRRPVEAMPDGIDWQACDVRNSDAVSAVFQGLGHRVDVVINCAGTGAFAPFEIAYEKYWRDIVDTNILGAINVISAVQDGALNASHFIAVSSMAAKRTSPTPGNDVYAATKAAFSRVHEDFRLRLRQDGSSLRVTLITPGFVEDTEFGKEFFRSNPEAATDLFSSFQSLTSDDVASAILWCLTRPNHVEIAEVVLRPRGQPI